LQNEGKLDRIKVYILMLKEGRNEKETSDWWLPLLFDFLRA